MAHRVSAGSFTDLDELDGYIIRTSGYCYMAERESREYMEGKREPFEWGFRGETEISSSFDQLGGFDFFT